MALRAVEHIFTGATTPIASYDSTKTNLGTLMIQKSGPNPEDNFVGPLPVAVARPMEESTAVAMVFPSIINYSSTIDWVFLVEAAVATTRRIFLYEYDKTLATYNWKGFITMTTPNAGTTANRGFRALRYLHTTGTVAVAAPVSVYATGTVTVSTAGLVTHSATGFLASYVGYMIGFGSTNVAQINCWYPIISFATTATMNILGASSAYAAGTAFVIASCTVTGTSTLFTTDLIAAGTASTAIAGGLGPRIGFGSTDPTAITQWYHIGKITSDTSIGLTTSPGVIPAGTVYVIEELRFALAISNSTTAANGGLFLLKGAGYHDFTTAGSTFPAITSAVTNQRGVYWLADAATVTNTTANGLAVATETDKQTHTAYILNGTNTSNAIIYKYNLRANDAVAAGKMTLAGANIVITGTQALTGTIPNQSANNLDLATTSHGPGSGSSYLYFVTTTRLYCAAVSAITAANTPFAVAANARQEIPPGGVSTFAASATLTNMRYIDTIDRFAITTFTASTSLRQYITRYPSTDTTPFDHIFGVDDKQQDQSLAFSAPIHFNTGAQLLSTESSNGVLHIIRMGATALLNQMYALPFGAHWTYASTTSQRVVTPSINTTGCVKFDQVLVYDEHDLGTGEIKLGTEAMRVYYRTADIGVDATSSWTLLGADNNLSGVPAANAIQFMFEFFTIGTICIPARIMKVAVTYEDGFTDSHYQLSAGVSDITNERFVWRFTHPFGSTVPTLKIELFDAATGSSELTDLTVGPVNGTWTKSIDGGSSWVVYDTDDKINEITYIRYIPSAALGSITVRALLTQN